MESQKRPVNPHTLLPAAARLAAYFLSAICILAIQLYTNDMMKENSGETARVTQRYLLALAEEMAETVTVEELKQFQSEEDTAKPEYMALKQKLADFAERHEITYAYYFKAVGDGNKYYYIIDNVTDPETWDSFKNIYEDSGVGARVFDGEPYVTGIGEYDPLWDNLMYAFQPMFDSDGSIYCAAGVDADDTYFASQVKDSRRLMIVQIFILALSVGAGILNMLFYRKQAHLSAGASAAKSRFLASMSHEIRTPMNAIIGMTAIGKTAATIERKNYALGKIEGASAHLLGVINDILDLSKIEAEKWELSPTAFNIEKTLQKAVNVINFRVEEKRLDFHVHIDRDIPPVLVADDQRFAQVVTNLLSNAVKFTPEGGRITLSARLAGEENGVCTVRVEVADTGIGISEEQRARLFTSYQQAESGTSRKFGGTGLGLVISKQIVERMGGRIWVESEPGKGSTFGFTFRSVRGEPGQGPHENGVDGAAAEERREDLAGRFKGFRLLLAEDVEINREILLTLLEPTGLEIECAENGREAVRMFTENPGRYDIVFMDVQMPEMDGYEATARIREAGGRLPIIAMTADVFREDVEKCLAAGMNGHLGKPLDLDDVFKQLKRYLK